MQLYGNKEKAASRRKLKACGLSPSTPMNCENQPAERSALPEADAPPMPPAGKRGVSTTDGTPGEVILLGNWGSVSLAPG